MFIIFPRPNPYLFTYSYPFLHPLVVIYIFWGPAPTQSFLKIPPALNFLMKVNNFLYYHYLVVTFPFNVIYGCIPQNCGHVGDAAHLR